MRITRTLTTFHVSAVKANFATQSFEVIAETDVLATSLTKTSARKALYEAGFNVPKGTDIVIEKVSETIYACELSDFLSIAVPVEKVNTEDVE